MNRTDLAIETIRLGKRYGDVTAVADLSLRVRRGEIYAFLGLNGAGKTTTIRMLLGMVRPSAGEARLLGERVRGGRSGPWARVGYLVEQVSNYPELTVRETLEMTRRLRPGTEAKAVGRVISRLGLQAYADRRAGTLSLGNAQRLGLAKALLHEPELLLLDEPANGLDPAGIVEMRDLLRALAAEQGVTVFMSSHILGEVARLAQQVGIIHEGRLIREMDRADLNALQQERLVVRTRDNGAALQALVAAGKAACLAAEGEIWLQDSTAVARPEQVASLLVQAGQPPFELRVTREDLEQTFLRLVGSPAAAAAEMELSS